MKIIPFYLPQFHNIPENDSWWGDGFTEWTLVKSAKPCFDGHYQPRIPLNRNYYNLLDDDVKIWQANIAKQYGIYGFCYYHYWFNGKLLLEKPMEQMLINKKIDIPFCVCWANEAWSKQWVGNETKILIPQFYGREVEWERHFDYLYKFIVDDRYIYKDGKPIIVIYRPEIIPCINEMIRFWRKCAKKKGLSDICMIGVVKSPNYHKDYYIEFDNILEWNPAMAWNCNNKEKYKFLRFLKKIRLNFWKHMESKFGCDLFDRYDPFCILNKLKNRNGIIIDDYQLNYENILKFRPLDSSSIPSAFVGWDNSPRYKEKSKVLVNNTPDIFCEYLKKQILYARNEYKSDFLFMFAWNEWSEGGYLEPDENFKYGYLEAVYRALKETNELG